jgi:predicted esterase
MNVKSMWTLLVIGLAVGMAGGCGANKRNDLTPLAEAAVAGAGDNAPQLRRALDEVPADQRPGMQFLVAHMPQRDRESLTADYLLRNVRLAYRAWREAPWGDQISETVFFNEVLPYACINERRDDWRADFYERFKPLVAEAKTPGEAAVILNQKIFDMLGVKFGRSRPKADQSPLETIEAGVASCTGLSVLLVDACRAVGVPARLAGTPLWADRSGNHSWVEVWDGQWYYTGAAEPAGGKLNRAWFAQRARTAQRDHELHAIYATSWRPTGLRFPMVWDLKSNSVHAVNVTDRYAPPRAAAESVDPPAHKPPSKFDVEASLHAVAQLGKYLKQPRDKRPPLDQQGFATVPLTREDAAKAQQLLWLDHVAMIRETRADEMHARQLADGEMVMPFYCKVYGEKPAHGRSLYISMHGGGGAPKHVNDKQWNNQKRLYQPDEGVYVAPRAPTNTWNLWHQPHIDRLFDRLIENLIVFEDVDPNRVYILGYSAGGDGVYQLAPRMADRLAAAAMMAGHPNESKPLGLRNLPFTIHVGRKDAAYKRNTVARRWGDELAALHKADPEGYIHWTKIYEDKGHWLDREDAAALPWMAKHTRNPLPDRIVWRQDNVTHTRFYWLAIPESEQRKDAVVRASRAGQRIEIHHADVDSLTIALNDQMLDLDKPVTVMQNGKALFEGRVPRTIGNLAGSLAERGDPASVFSAAVTVAPEEPEPEPIPASETDR